MNEEQAFREWTTVIIAQCSECGAKATQQMIDMGLIDFCRTSEHGLLCEDCLEEVSNG